ncbi:MAG: NAD(P)H-dependent oxidoreductase subunit E [Anaerolineae bacterium]|nr:NAD(P)H-dependent oxidoreductase subunit E [Anaerolineae bacterium]
MIHNLQSPISNLQSPISKIMNNDLVAQLREINQRLGYIPRAEIEKLAREMRVPAAKVLGVATFYSLFSVKPRGKHVVRFCEDAPCHVAGGQAVYDAIRTTLQLEPGQTSADGKWTFEVTSCLGICGVGPVMMVDDEVYGNVTPERVVEILTADR